LFLGCDERVVEELSVSCAPPQDGRTKEDNALCGNNWATTVAMMVDQMGHTIERPIFRPHLWNYKNNDKSMEII